MKKKLFLMILIMIACLLSSCLKETPETDETDTATMLELTLTLDKLQYSLDDNIAGTLILTNKGSEELLVNGRMALNRPDAPEPFRDIVITIFGPDGQKIKTDARIDVGFPNDDDFQLITPGGSIKQNYSNLQRLFPIEIEGEYKISAVYQNSRDPTDGTAWKGEIKSNIVTLEVQD